MEKGRLIIARKIEIEVSEAVYQALMSGDKSPAGKLKQLARTYADIVQHGDKNQNEKHEYNPV